MNGKKHLAYIDQLKGIAIILVVWGHCGWSYFYDTLYYLHLPVFVICTGMLIGYKGIPENPIPMIRKLCGRLMYPFLMFGLISIFVFLCVNAVAYTTYSIKYRLKEILTLGYDACWFLPALFFGESIAILVIYLFEKKLKKKIFIIAGMAVMVLVAEVLRRLLWENYGDYSSNSFLNGEKMIILLITTRILLFAFYVLAGYMLFPGITKVTELIHSKEKNLGKLMASAGCIALFVLMIFVTKKAGFVDLRLVCWDNTAVYLVCCLTISISLILFFMVSKIQIRLLAFLGKHSLVIMGVHMSMLKFWLSRMLVLKYAPAELMQKPTLNGIVTTVLTLVLVIPEIYIFDKAFPFLLDWEKAKQLLKSKKNQETS